MAGFVQVRNLVSQLTGPARRKPRRRSSSRIEKEERERRRGGPLSRTRGLIPASSATRGRAGGHPRRGEPRRACSARPRSTKSGAIIGIPHRCGPGWSAPMASRIFGLARAAALLCLVVEPKGGWQPGTPHQGRALRLGHSLIQMTADTYGRLFPRHDDAAEWPPPTKRSWRSWIEI